MWEGQGGFLALQSVIYLSSRLKGPGMVCSEPYGILPCSEGVVGSIFLLLVYGFIVLQGARWISEGSELLLKVKRGGFVSLSLCWLLAYAFNPGIAEPMHVLVL